MSILRSWLAKPVGIGRGAIACTTQEVALLKHLHITHL